MDGPLCLKKNKQQRDLVAALIPLFWKDDDLRHEWEWLPDLGVFETEYASWCVTELLWRVADPQARFGYHTSCGRQLAWKKSQR